MQNWNEQTLHHWGYDGLITAIAIGIKKNMSVFGKELFNFRKPPVYMYDFAQHGIINSRESFDLMEYTIREPIPVSTIEESLKEVKKSEKPKKPTIDPKALYDMKALNDREFTINIDPLYIVQQIEMVQEKLDILGKKPKVKKSRNPFEGVENEFGAVKYGRIELESLMERLKNRRKIDGFEKLLEKYPHTTSKLLNKIIAEHSNLRAEPAAQFVPDFPREAINAMKEYDEMCVKLCNKRAIFYVVADKKDFEKIPTKRDPILLAQSPFGFFWQILGAWDDEMIYLGDL